MKPRAGPLLVEVAGCDTQVRLVGGFGVHCGSSVAVHFSGVGRPCQANGAAALQQKGWYSRRSGGRQVHAAPAEGGRSRRWYGDLQEVEWWSGGVTGLGGLGVGTLSTVEVEFAI
jgi:hypothetical protein